MYSRVVRITVLESRFSNVVIMEKAQAYSVSQRLCTDTERWCWIVFPGLFYNVCEIGLQIVPPFARMVIHVINRCLHVNQAPVGCGTDGAEVGLSSSSG